MYFNTLKN